MDISIEEAKKIIQKNFPDRIVAIAAKHGSEWIFGVYDKEDIYHTWTTDPLYSVDSTKKVKPFSPAKDLKWFKNVKWEEL